MEMQSAKTAKAISSKDESGVSISRCVPLTFNLFVVVKIYATFYFFNTFL